MITKYVVGGLKLGLFGNLGGDNVAGVGGQDGIGTILDTFWNGR